MRSNNKVEYEVQPDGDSFVVKRGGAVMTTPGGKELRSRFPNLLNEVKEGLETFGPDPSAGCSLYVMMASYLDFGLFKYTKDSLTKLILSDIRILSRHSPGPPGDIISYAKDLHITTILSDMENDKAFDIPADPEFQYLRGCYMNSSFERWGVAPGFSPPDYPGLCHLVKPELEGLSLRQIMTIVLFVTHHHSSTLGLALVEGTIELSDLAQGLCDLLASWNGVGRIGDSFDWNEWEEQYDPIDYCRDVCCKYGDTEYPIILNDRCLMLQDLEKFRRFSRFPDE